MRNMKTENSIRVHPFLSGMLFAAMFAASSLAAAVPYRATDLLSIDYDGPIAEAKPVQRNCVEFTAPGGDTVSLYLGSSKNVPGWLSYKEGGAGATKHGPIPVGMVGFDPVAAALDDGRVVIAHVNPFEPDAKVYGFRMMAWIGPWASLKAGSTFGWGKYVGSNGLVMGIDHFGESAPCELLAKEYGFTAEAVAEHTLKYLGK